MQRIDAHQHFWQFDPVRDSWIDDSMKVLRQDFMPNDLLPYLQASGIEGCVAVQADQSVAETDFLLALAKEHLFIKGVVGWVDLLSDNLEAQLEKYRDQPVLKGFRHILQSEEDRAFMLQPRFVKSVNLLQRMGFTYDILIYEDQLLYAAELVKACPGQRFVIDHLAKPPVKTGAMENWKGGITAMAQYPNVTCKVSGLVTEGNWEEWMSSEFHPYLDVVVDAFGTGRLMYGSDWPVCLLAANYATQYRILSDYFRSFTDAEQAAVFGTNAIRFYNL